MNRHKRNVNETSIMLTVIIAILVHVLSNKTIIAREPTVRKKPRLNWESSTYSKYRDDKETIRTLRMHPDSFDKLVDALRPDLTRNCKMAKLRGGAYTPELCLFITIRYLCGAQVLDLIDAVGGHKSTMYYVIWSTIRAIIKSKDPILDNIHFPKTYAECYSAAQGFAGISYKQAIINCVGVVDGYLLHIKAPSEKRAGNVKSYFSGHYQRHGVNVQACCDHNCRFTFLGVAGPGSMADRVAISETELGDLVNKLPDGFVCIGDCAYTASEGMAPIYYGSAVLSDAKYDNYNYFASQLRIRIEMAFGLMQSKWLILETALRCKLSNVRILILAIARLHNFCINERLKENISSAKKHSGMYAETMQHRKDGSPISVNEDGERLRHIPGHSAIRVEMVDRVESLGLKRPSRRK